MGLATDDAPPTYTEATTHSPSLSSPSTRLDGTSTNPTTGLPTTFSSPLTTHLRTLPARLRANQLAHKTVQAAHDFDLTAQIVPHIEAFLADLTAMPRTPPVAELTLVPASAVPAGSGMSGAVERRREGEVVRVGRVDVAGVVYDDQKGRGVRREGVSGVGDEDREDEEDGRRAREVGFDEWGRFDTDGNDADGGGKKGKEKGWWFTDEEMACRLALYLRPEPNLERKHVQAAVVEQKRVVKEEKSGWGKLFGSGKKKAVSQPPPLVPPPVSPALSSPGSTSEDDSVKMTVRAEEVTFRWENDFGIWESKTGWGIVVTVRVKP